MARRLTIILALLILASGAANADKRKISIALTAGVFRPTSSSTRSEFGSTWTRIGLKSFDAVKPTEWRFSAEAGSYRVSGDSKVKLYPITVGVERGLNDNPRVQPYVTVRCGPYFGTLNSPASAADENHTGLNVNAAYGFVIKRKFYVEARYDYFSKLSGWKFDGISLSAGVRLFDVKL